MVWLATFPLLPNLFRMRFRPLCLLITLWSVVALGAFGGVAGLPPVSGELSGELKVRALAGAPPLGWRVQVTPAAGGMLQLVATVTAPGFALRAEASQPADGSPGVWRVVQGEVDLAAWQRSGVAAVGVKLPADFEVSGKVQLSGSGTLENLKPVGVITSTLSSGRAGSVEQAWEVADLELASTLALGTDGVTLQAAQLRASSATAAGIVARNLVAEAAGLPDGHIEVRRVELEVLGGRVALAPFTLDPATMLVRVQAEVTNLALKEIAALLPETLADAKGRLSGKMEVRWSPTVGFEPGRGALQIHADEPAALRLAATPGFLTQHMPERIFLLPEKLGALAKWFAPKNPAFDSLRHIELGEDSLTVEKMKVELYPDGPDGVRSATVEVTARPPKGSIVEQVSFTINVAGPLKQVLDLSLDDRARINFKPTPDR